jgi:large subunit ribosomal protein L24
MAIKNGLKKGERLSTSLRRGDPVMVVAGGNKHKRPLKGQVSKIKAIVGDKADRVILDGLNLYVRHKRAQGPGQEGGKVQVEQPVHISNVMYYVEKLKKPVRLVSGLSADGKKVRGYTDPKTNKFVELEA